MANLVEQGYTIALDGFVFGASHERLLDLASYMKIDRLHAAEEYVRSAVETAGGTTTCN